MTTIAIVYHSQTGRTKALAEAVLRGAIETDGVVAHLVAVEDGARSQDILASADAIVLGCPTYMGSASAAFKAFMDATSAVWALQGWRDKLAAGFTHSAAPSGDKLGTLTQLAVFAAQHGMIWVGLGLPPSYVAMDSAGGDVNRLGSHLGAMAASRPGGGELPLGDVRTAEHLGRRVAIAATRWRLKPSPSTHRPGPVRHPTARGWSFPPLERPALEAALERTNLREIVARAERFEHHLVVVASIDGAQLEVTAASEPLYFAHINVSDEFALSLPSGDELVDRFPLRTFLTDPATGTDVGRYNHRTGDVVLHPLGLLHWPGRLRPPYEPFDFPAGMRRAGLSLVYCASRPTAAGSSPLPPAKGRENDQKAYVDPAPPMMVASTRGPAGVLASVGTTTLALVEAPTTIAPPHGGWVVVLEANATSVHAPCDLVRIPPGKSLDGGGIARALVLSSPDKPPDPTPASWRTLVPPPFAPYEDSDPGTLPFAARGVNVDEGPEGQVIVTIEGRHADVPRYWLARMLFRVALHGVRLGYVETYGGLFVDDREESIRIGIREADGDGSTASTASAVIARNDALGFVEQLYRAVAPIGYRERPS